MKQIVFRTDAALHIGTGHMMRCLTLAEALRERGAAASFVCREHDGQFCELIAARGFALSRLPRPAAGVAPDPVPPHANWLGASWQDDAAQTRAALGALSRPPDWLVVDHYALDRRWEGALRPSVGRIMAIDDLADRDHDCDLLLDQNLVARLAARYAARTPDGCRHLLGPQYALLQPGYAVLHENMKPRDGTIRRIFIFFGGVDQGNLTGRALNAVLRLERSEIEVDIVIGAGNPLAAALQRQIAPFPQMHLHHSLPSLGPLMAQADLVLGAGGATSWERLCLGLPAMVVTLAENQIPVAQELERQGLIHWLGNADDVSEQCMIEQLSAVLDGAKRPAWMAPDRGVVDGRGAGRVCEALLDRSEP